MSNRRVAVLLANGFEELEATAFTDVFGWSRAEGEQPVDLETVALHQQVRGTWNLTVTPERVIAGPDDLQGFDALAIPGGFEEAGYYQDAFSELFQQVIRNFNQELRPIAAVCVGALALGKSGILAGRQATTYSYRESPRLKQLDDFGAKVTRKHLCQDGHLITSCGPSSAIDVAFLLLELLTTQENRETVQRAMGYSPEAFLERIA